MPFDPEIHRRRSIRLEGYDYSQPGTYYVTVCTHDHRCLFGGVVGEAVKLTRAGKIVQEEWLNTPVLRPNVRLDEFVSCPTICTPSFSFFEAGCP